MSIATHERRLRRLERPDEAGEVGLLDLLMLIDQERQAAMALVDFARSLAGTDEAARLQRLAMSPPARPRPSSAPTDLPPGRDNNGRRVWTLTERPGPHDVLTWDEVLRVPWLDGASAAWVTPQLPAADPGRPRDPWANWGVIGPPSYAKEE